METLHKIWKVILWILFWYYLIPYYLLKKYAFHNVKRPILWSSLSSIFIVFVCLGILGNILPDDSESTSNSEAKTHYVIKKVGKKRLTAALATQKLLAKEEKKKKRRKRKPNTKSCSLNLVAIKKKLKKKK